MPTIPERLLSLAADAREQARRIRDEAEREATRLEQVAALCESQAGERLTAQETVLHEARRKSTVNSVLTADHRMAISEGSRPRGKTIKDPFHPHIRARGFTQNRLAAAVGIDKALLSRYRRKKKPAAIPSARAAEIEKLTGWPADAKHWPGGIQ
jgi:DNA-binding Xre family transcriptional regulator